MTSYINDLLDGLAQGIAAASIGTYSPAGVYTPSQTGIYFSLMPAGSEGQPPGTDRCIVLSTYPVSDHPNQALSRVGVQIRTRGTTDPRDVNTLDESIFQLVQGLTNVNYGTCHVIQLLRNSGVPMGMDSNRRWEHSSNYYADINPPATAYRNQ